MGKKMDALIMAGGLGKRLLNSKIHKNNFYNGRLEKPLLLINNRPMIDYIISELKKSKRINDIYVSVSKNTPYTREYLAKKYDLNIINTSGKNYIYDLNKCIPYFKGPFLTIPSDIPLINHQDIDKIIDYYLKFSFECLTVWIEERIYIGEPTLVYNGYVPSGINIMLPKKDIQKEERYLLNKPLINVNTYKDLKLVEDILKTTTNKK